MSKAHRGFGIRDQKNNGRGTCPVCNRTGIKVLYDAKIDEQAAKVCKQCSAKLKNAK